VVIFARVFPLLFLSRAAVSSQKKPRFEFASSQRMAIHFAPKAPGASVTLNKNSFSINSDTSLSFNKHHKKQ
jgi:hypothetical protein